VLVVLALALLGARAFVHCGPLPHDPRAHSLEGGLKFYDRHGRLLYEAASGAYLPLEQIPMYPRQATIATEDSSFCDNPGVDPVSVGRALLQDVRSGRLFSGGSTISQQLARNLYMSDEERSSQSLWRKVKETVFAIRLNRALSKDEILGLYLKRTYHGNLAYGVEAAARTYFNKSAWELDLAESALLAGLPQSPAAYDPSTRLEAARNRQQTVLRLMVEAGYVTEEQADAASREPLCLNPTPFPIEAPHFVVYAQGLLPGLVGEGPVREGGLKVNTTLDLDLRREADAAIDRRLQELRDRGASNAALVAEAPSHGVG
jgi:membrane peptidoglycan carboxypeptidase